MDDDGVSMVSQYTIATASHAGTRHGGRHTPAATHPAAPQREAAEHRAGRRHGLRTVLCLALTAAAAYVLRVRWTCASLHPSWTRIATVALGWQPVRIVWPALEHDHILHPVFVLSRQEVQQGRRKL